MVSSGSSADAFEARSLLRAARQGALATVSSGEPHCSLVTPATTGEGDVLLLLSGLSAHTRALGEAAACALLVSGIATEANPQTAPRVSIHGEAERLAGDEAERARLRYVAIHPYATLYAGFGDFAVWRVRPRSALFVGGFGRARTLAGASLLVDAPASDALQAAAADLCRLAGPDAVAIDADGFDRVRPDGGTMRIGFDAPARDPRSFEAALDRLAARGNVAAR